MARVDVANAAKWDIADIWRYVAADNVPAADRLAERFATLFQRLAAMPRLGQRYEHRVSGIRVFTAGSYVVAYRELKDGIAVLRVDHAAGDWQAILDASSIDD